MPDQSAVYRNILLTVLGLYIPAIYLKLLAVALSLSIRVDHALKLKKATLNGRVSCLCCVFHQALISGHGRKELKIPAPGVFWDWPKRPAQ